MKKLILLAALAFASVTYGQTVVNLQVSLNDEQVWALTQDWQAYRDADPTNNTLTKMQWFVHNSTNMIHTAANRRIVARSQELMSTIQRRWTTLTPAQKTNVLVALPPE